MGDHYGRHEIEADRKREELRATKTMADVLAKQAAVPRLRPVPTADRRRALREERGIGLAAAKSIIRRRDLLADIEVASTIDDIKALLVRMA